MTFRLLLVFDIPLFLMHFLYFDYLHFPEVFKLSVLFDHCHLRMLPIIQLDTQFFSL